MVSGRWAAGVVDMSVSQKWHVKFVTLVDVRRERPELVPRAKSRVPQHLHSAESIGVRRR